MLIGFSLAILLSLGQQMQCKFQAKICGSTGNLVLVKVLNIGEHEDVVTNNGCVEMFKCSVDTDLKLLAMESKKMVWLC